MTKPGQKQYKSERYHRWNDEEIAMLIKMYPDTQNSEIARHFRVKPQCVQYKAQQLHLKKSKEFIAQQRKVIAKHPNVIASQFKKGHVPTNKGKKETDFMTKEKIDSKNQKQKKAHKAQNNLPLGTEIKRSNGYIYVKTENGMMPKHRLVWMQNHGTIPKGMRIVFLDGNKNNCTIENLILVTANEAGKMMADKISKQERKRIQMKANETRRLTIEKDRRRMRWGFPPKTKLFKRDR